MLNGSIVSILYNVYTLIWSFIRCTVCNAFLIFVCRDSRLMWPVARLWLIAWRGLSCQMTPTSMWCWGWWRHAVWPRRSTSVVECYLPQNTSIMDWQPRFIHTSHPQSEGDVNEKKCMNYGRLYYHYIPFSSPQVKAQVSFSDHPS